MVDILKINRDKDKIISTIRMRGPSLPVQIAKSIGMSPLFASAFLSELKAEEKIKISDMKVGSSPLYYIPGQETMLENFVEHLNQKEREAFRLLKNEKILSDEQQTPVIRVALRSIKDFAVPIRVKTSGNGRLFWKHFSVSDSEFESMVKNMLLRQIKEEKKPVEEKEEKISEKKHREKKVKEEIKEEKGTMKVEVKGKKIQESDFTKNIKDYLNEKKIEILQVRTEKKKDFIAKIRIDTLFGKQEFYLIARDKKNVSENDLAIALQNAQAEKMPALFMSFGELNKKAKEYAKQWSNLIKIEKLKF